MHRVLSQIEIAENSDKRGEYTSGFRAIDGIQSFLYLLDSVCAHSPEGY